MERRRNLRSRIRSNIVVYSSVLVIGFGLLNLSIHDLALAQEVEVPASSSSALIDTIVERVITEAGPILAGVLSLAFTYARKQGYKISGEAEEYFVNSAESFVAKQSRWLYKQVRDNPQYSEQLKRGRIPRELGEAAKKNLMNELEIELRSDEFTKTARQMLRDNLDPLVERYVTENKKENAEKVRNLLNDLVPRAVDAALLPFSTPEQARRNSEEIVKEALESVAKTMEFEELFFSHEDAMMRIKSELSKAIRVPSKGAGK
jgi:hypothetical protein